MDYTVNDIADIIATDASLSASKKIINGESPVKSLLTDSRSRTETDGTLFFALKTSRADGHDYIPQLYAKGVRHFVVDSSYIAPQDAFEGNFIFVSDTKAALRRIAAHHRQRFSIPVVAITGSRKQPDGAD